MNTLTLTTSYAENWRYNILVTLSIQNSEGEQVGFHSIEDSPLPLGNQNQSAPEGFLRQRRVEVEFEPCDKIRLYVYILPNSLPETTTLKGIKTTFPLQVKIACPEKVYLSEKWEINRFGGCGREVVLSLT